MNIITFFHLWWKNIKVGVREEWMIFKRKVKDDYNKHFPKGKEGLLL